MNDLNTVTFTKDDILVIEGALLDKKNALRHNITRIKKELKARMLKSPRSKAYKTEQVIYRLEQEMEKVNATLRHFWGVVK